MEHFKIPRIKGMSDITYDNFSKDINKLIDLYMSDYYYFNFKDETWYSLICNIIKANQERYKNLEQFERLITKILYNHCHNYIQTKLKNKEPRIFVNLLFSLKNTYPKTNTILKQFVRTFEVLGICLKEEDYLFLKTIPVFANFLTQLQINDFTYLEFNDYINNDYSFYYSLKPHNLTLRETVIISKFLLSFYPKETQLQILNKEDLPKVEKIKFLVINYAKLLKIYTTYFKKYPKDVFFQLIIDKYPLEQLEPFINEPQLYIDAVDIVLKYRAKFSKKKTSNDIDLPDVYQELKDPILTDKINKELIDYLSKELNIDSVISSQELILLEVKYKEVLSELYTTLDKYFPFDNTKDLINLFETISKASKENILRYFIKGLNCYDSNKAVKCLTMLGEYYQTQKNTQVLA